MRFGIHTLDDYDVQGKTVLCRVDINQPVDRKKGVLKSMQRIQACVPTLRELSDKGAKVVVLAHQGSDIEYKNFYSTEPHAHVLEQLLERKVFFVDDVCGPAAREKIRALKDGDILLLDNVRFCAEEQTLFEMNLCLSHEEQAQTEVVRKLAPLADLYVCDAFAAAHRDQPSLCGFEQVLPSAMGRLFEKEYCVVSELMENPRHPCVFILGGSKISDAFMMMNTVLKKGTADRILTGGLVGQILLASQGKEIGEGSMAFIRKSGYGDYIEQARPLLDEYPGRILLPQDLAGTADGRRTEAKIPDIPRDFCAADIGALTAEKYREQIMHARTVFMNGPVGVFEEEMSEYGTKEIFGALAKTEAYTVVGGGDSVTAAKKYGVTDKMDYVCTGGGALIRFLTGEELPVIRALRHAAERFPVKNKEL